MTRPLDIVVFGPTITSSRGNGHATTYRALLKGLHEQEHRVRFLERDVPCHAAHRDLPDPDFCTLGLYRSLDTVLCSNAGRLMSADAVIVGSSVPEGAALIDRLLAMDLAQLCFYDIDTPETLARLARGEEEYLARRQIPRLDLYLSLSGGAVLRRLERDWGAVRAEALHSSVDPALYRPTGAVPEWDLGYLGTWSPDRQPALERLLIEPARRLPERRFVVAGAQLPDLADWPANVERIAHLPSHRRADFYNRQRFTLNVTRPEMIAAGWSPPARLFEAAACGTPIVSDDWRGLRELFPDAVRIVRSTEDVVRTLVTVGEAERCAMAERARRLVLERHTGAVRAAELARVLSGAGALRALRPSDIPRARLEGVPT
ncbi:MAG: CgeB family protein [Roseicyclus sp.]